MAKGETFVARGLPVGWINPTADLLIGPGAVVDLALLDAEIAEAELRSGSDVRNRVLIDHRAHALLPIHHEQENGTEGEAHKRIGSTGEGIGPVRMARIARGTRDENWLQSRPVGTLSVSDLRGMHTGDTAAYANRLIDGGVRVLLEGTQGSALSLTHGDWPFVTSHDTNAATLAADAGIAPQLVHTLLVARTFPIRVAGNSGPLTAEITWKQLGVIPETTTVTKKERRIGLWDWHLVERAVMLNRPVGLALTFLDYWDGDVRGRDWEGLTDDIRSRVTLIASSLDVPVLFCSTGPAGTRIIDVPQRVMA